MLSAQLALAAAVGLVLGGIVAFFLARRRERAHQRIDRNRRFRTGDEARHHDGGAGGHLQSGPEMPRGNEQVVESGNRAEKRQSARAVRTQPGPCSFQRGLGQ